MQRVKDINMSEADPAIEYLERYLQDDVTTLSVQNVSDALFNIQRGANSR